MCKFRNIRNFIGSPVIVAELDALQAEVDALKRLQAETAVNNTGQAAARLRRQPRHQQRLFCRADKPARR